ncbi:hypothetical protein Tco_1358364 [Tanacetum coccineum]
MEGYGSENVTLNPTQVFSVYNWTLKKNQPEGPPFTNHMLAICKAEKPFPLKAPKTSSKDEKCKIEATKGRSSSKEPTGSKTGHLVTKTQSSSAMDSNPSEPSASTHVVVELHKEDQQATGGPTSLGVTSEGGAHLQLSSKQTKSTSKGLETVLTQPTTRKGASNIGKKIEEDFNTSTDLSISEDTQKDIKLEDLSKLVLDVGVDFIDLDSPNDDEPIIVQDESDKEVHTEKAQNSKLKKEKTDAEAEVAFLSAQPSFPNVEQLIELLVKSLQPELSKILSTYDFTSSLPTELKELPSKFTKLTGEVKELKKHVHDLKIELPGDLKEIPTKLDNFTSTAKIKTLDALPSLLNRVAKALNKFAQVIESASTKVGDKGVPSVGPANTKPVDGRRILNKQQYLNYFKEELQRMLKRLT